MDNYFISENYRRNKENLTNDKVSNKNYWDRNRIIAAEVYQFPTYKFVSKYISKNKINKLIDIGCGVGCKLVYIKNKNENVNIIGIDQDDPIRYCRKTYDFGEWYVDDLENTKISKDVKANLIISCDVIEHLVNPDLLLDYIKTKIEKDGVIVLSTPERNALRGVDCRYSPNKHHIREWSYEEFEQYLESRGFEIVNHFLQYPIKMKINTIYYNEIIKRAIRLKPLRYNQVIVLRVK